MPGLVILEFRIILGLVCAQREALVVNYCEVLVGSLQVVSNRELAVLDELLVEQTVLLVDAVDTALHDVLDHLSREVCSLLCRYSSDDLLSLGNVLSCGSIPCPC